MRLKTSSHHAKEEKTSHQKDGASYPLKNDITPKDLWDWHIYRHLRTLKVDQM